MITHHITMYKIVWRIDFLDIIHACAAYLTEERSVNSQNRFGLKNIPWRHSGSASKDFSCFEYKKDPKKCIFKHFYYKLMIFDPLKLQILKNDQ